MSEYGLDRAMAEIFIRNIALAAYYEDAMSECANWTKEEEIKNDVAPPNSKAGKNLRKLSRQRHYWHA